MKLKKVLFGATAVALTAAVSIGATLAYLTDSDEDVNVMTLGNVYIDQIEQERVDNADNQNQLVDFEQNQPMLPAVYPGDSIPWAPEDEWVVPGDEAWRVVEDNTNVIDKFVTVKNTGESEAYVRTIFAFEYDYNLLHAIMNDEQTPGDAVWTWDWSIGEIELNGVKYILAEAVYTGKVAPGATTIPSLKQIYLDKIATNEDCAKFGDTYDILVFSQAVQADGFDSVITGAAAALDEAFGDITTTNNPWINGNSSYAPASKGVIPALAEGGKATLSSDITVTDEAAASKNVITNDTELNFGGNTVTLDLPNATGATENWVGVNVNGGNVVFDGAEGGITTADNPELYAIVVRNGANLTINGGKYIGGTSAISVTAGTVTINGGYFANQTDDAEYLLNCYDSAYNNGTASIIVKGGSFLNWNPADNAAEGAGTNFVAPGYTVIEEAVDGGILYTVVEA